MEGPYSDSADIRGWDGIQSIPNLYHTLLCRSALVRVAILSNRTVAFPPLSANISWVVPGFKRQQLPLRPAGEGANFICYGVGSWDDVRCGRVGIPGAENQHPEYVAMSAME